MNISPHEMAYPFEVRLTDQACLRKRYSFTKKKTQPMRQMREEQQEFNISSPAQISDRAFDVYVVSRPQGGGARCRRLRHGVQMHSSLSASRW